MTVQPPYSTGPMVSVVINTDGRCQSLARTLDALRFQTYRNFEICVVCGPKPDGTREFVAERTSARLLKAANCDERNLSTSRNIGIGLAAGEFIAFIDDDALPEPIWLEQLLKGFTQPAVAAVSGLVYQPDGHRLQFRFSSCDRFGNARHDLATAADASAFPMSAHFPHVMGTNAMFRRAALVAVGGFDEEYDYYLDEADLCCRLVDAGWLIRQRSDAPVHHLFLSGTVRDGEGITNHFEPILKNQLYFSLVNGRQHATLPQILEAALGFAAQHRREIASHVARGVLHRRALASFDDDHDRAAAAGLSRGLSGKRRLPAPKVFDAAPAFLQAPSLASSNGAERQRHVVIVAKDDDDSLTAARERAHALERSGSFARLLVSSPAAARSHVGVAIRDRVWHQHAALAEDGTDPRRVLRSTLDRIASCHPIDEIEDLDGYVQKTPEEAAT